MSETAQSVPAARTKSAGQSVASDVALIACFAAVIAVCAILPAIHVGGLVPITLQTFAVLLAGAVLGAKRGALAVLLYLAVGAIGLPVFSGGAAGIAPFVGPSAGYLIAFPCAAALCGFLVERLPVRRSRQVCCSYFLPASGRASYLSIPLGRSVFLSLAGSASHKGLRQISCSTPVTSLRILRWPLLLPLCIEPSPTSCQGALDPPMNSHRDHI